MQKWKNSSLLIFPLNEYWNERHSIYTFSFTSSCSGNGTANDDVVWTDSFDAAESNFDNTKDIHYSTSSKAISYLRLTSSDIIISSIVGKSLHLSLESLS